MAAEGISLALIVGGIVPNLVAEHSHLQAVVKEFLCNLEVQIHRHRYAREFVERLAVGAYQPLQVCILLVASLPVVYVSIRIDILIGRVAYAVALRHGVPQELR